MSNPPHIVPPDAFDIHRDDPARRSHTQRLQSMLAEGTPTDSDTSRDVAETEGQDEALEEEIDESVKEDMRKLEETFTGISERYRLINRIGEGENSDLLHSRPY